MFRAIAILVALFGVAGCNSFNTLVNGLAHARAVESDLEKTTGVKDRRWASIGAMDGCGR